MTIKTLLGVVFLVVVGIVLLPKFSAYIFMGGVFIAMILIWSMLANPHKLNRLKWDRLNEGKEPLGTAYQKYEGL